MKATVISEKCIACGKCFAIIPDVFDIDDEGLAYNKIGDDITIPSSFINATEKAANSCPTQAIQLVYTTKKAK